MDVGNIGCAADTPGGESALGNLDLGADFLRILQRHDNKPFKLAETYFECVMKPRDAMLESIGIAQGTTALSVASSLCCSSAP